MSQECPKTGTNRLDKTTQTGQSERADLHLLDTPERQFTLSCPFTHQRSAVRYRPRPPVFLGGLHPAQPCCDGRDSSLGSLRAFIAVEVQPERPPARRIEQLVVGAVEGVLESARNVAEIGWRPARLTAPPTCYQSDK